MILPKSTLDRVYELGKLHCDRGDFDSAIEVLKEAAEGFSAERNFPKYLKCLNLLLRMYAEREQSEEIHLIKEKLFDLVIKESVELGSKIFYTLALCSSYKGQNDTALEYLQKALAIAMDLDSKEDICYAVCGMAAVYVSTGRFDEALLEIRNLQIFLEVLDLPELKISAQMMNAMILAETKKYDEALELLWQTYDLIQKTKSLAMQIHLLINMGWIYALLGDLEKARIHLRLAKQSCDSKNMVRMTKTIEREMARIGEAAYSEYDLVFDLESHMIQERRLGKIDFKNQFILLELLRLFMQNQGQIYSKEYIVEQIWKQAYDPTAHDNKIYVTIKRLRKMIEPDFDKPKYIFRAKNGYFMNKAVKVHIDQRGT